MNKTVFYVASSVGTFETARYKRMSARIEKAVKAIHPESEFIYAKGLYQSARDWMQKWPRLCHEQVTGGLVFFTDEAGWIGRGVHTEMQCVFQKDLPVYLCTDQGELIEVTPELVSDRFTCEFDRDDWTRYALFVLVPRGQGFRNEKKQDTRSA